MYPFQALLESTGATEGEVKAWLYKHGFAFDAAGRSDRRRWSLADALKVAILHRLAADYGCAAPGLLGRLTNIDTGLNELVAGFKKRINSAPDDKPLAGPWLVVGPGGAVLIETFSEIAAEWQAAHDAYPRAYVAESFLILNVGALLARVRHNLHNAGGELE